MDEFGYKGKIVNYIKKNIKKGYTTDSLKFALVNQGYSRTAVETAIVEANKQLAEKAPILKEKPKIRYQIIDEHDKPINVKKSWWQRLVGL